MKKKEGQDEVRKKVWRINQINGTKKTAKGRTEYNLNEENIILATNLSIV